MTLARRIARTKIRTRLALGFLWYWRIAALVGVLFVAIVVAYVLLIPALGQLQRQAKAGNKARERQCRTAPISAKAFAWIERRGGITASELTTFMTPPPNCTKQ